MDTKLPRIRQGEFRDVLTLVHMADRFQNVAGFPLRGDPVYFSCQLRQIMMMEDAACFVIDLNEDGLAGFLIAKIERSFLTPDPIANEHMLWIEPNRRGRWFRPLISAYEAWAQQHGAVAAYLSAQMDDRTGKVFDRIGFEAVQTHHLKVF